MQAAAAKAKQWAWEWEVRGSDCMMEPTGREDHKPTANVARRETVEQGGHVAGRARGDCGSHSWGGCRQGEEREWGFPVEGRGELPG